MVPVRRFARLSLTRTAWAVLRHRHMILVGRDSVLKVHAGGRLNMAPRSVLAIGLVHGQAGARVEIDGTLTIYGRVQIMRGCRVTVRPGAILRIRDQSYLNDGSTVIVHDFIDVGKGCAISYGVSIVDSDGHILVAREVSAPVQIGDRCWIGAHSTILKGVQLGTGCVVGARSVVTKSAAPRSMLVGVPARVVDTDVVWGR